MPRIIRSRASKGEYICDVNLSTSSKNHKPIVKNKSDSFHLKPNRLMRSKSLFFNQQPLRKCANILTSSALCCLSLWLSLPGHIGQQYALRATQIIRIVYQLRHQLFQSKRHVIGFVLLGAGVLGYFSGSFFNPMDYDHAPCQVFGLVGQCYSFETRSGWCFMNWFYYLDTITWAIGLLFWSVAAILFIPQKHGLAIIPASLLHALGWVKVLHFTLFARSYETYHAFPDWQIITIALALGFGIVMSANYLIHTYNHRTLAFEKRLLTLYNGVDLLSGDQFKGAFKKYVEEKQAFQKTI